MRVVSPYNLVIRQATFKECAEDFVVCEQMAINFDGQGEHCWLRLKKTNLNTEFVARLLTKWANIAPSDVGFSGIKDRRAVTYQWFSLRLPKKNLPKTPFDEFAQAFLHDDEQLTVLETHWHGKKLGRGTHKSNHFEIILKNVVGDPSKINTELQRIAKHGVPNYFGEQRFGKDGNNVLHAHDFFVSLLQANKPYRPHKKDRHKHALLISTARSLLFNKTLSLRVSCGYWDTPIEGDVFNLNGTGSVFCADIDDEILSRIKAGDIHVAGSLYGTGQPLTHSQALLMEQDIAYHNALLVNGLKHIGVKLSYRPYRVLIQDLIWRWQDDTLYLSFTLPTGSFATSVLSAISAQLV